MLACSSNPWVDKRPNLFWRIPYAQFLLRTLQALEAMCAGRMLADVVGVIGSIDIVLGEIDR